MEKKNKTSMENIIDDFLRVFFYLEILMTNFIAYHIIVFDFSKKDKRKEFIERFLDDAQFYKKSVLLTNIIQDEFPQLKNKIVIEDFNKIRNLRNKIAHSINDFDLDIEKTNSKKILLKRFRKGEINQIQITDIDINMEIERSFKIIEILNNEVKKMINTSARPEAMISYLSSKNRIHDQK